MSETTTNSGRVFDPAELILRADGSIYHLGLFPEDVAETVITVGDPDRVDKITAHFDKVNVRKQNREFRTHTGEFGGRNITVISTGIGAGNIDIVLNELDALVNVDLQSMREMASPQQLKVIRLGTCGGLRKELEPGAIVVSSHAIGMDGLPYFYRNSSLYRQKVLEDQLRQQVDFPVAPYAVTGDAGLFDWAKQMGCISGITVTNAGFYGPQGRSIRLEASHPNLFAKLQDFEFEGQAVLNLEMETASIYALAAMLGHKACSLSVVLANRSTGSFSADAEAQTNDFIRTVLNHMDELV